jgi:hypothetical protein
VSESTAEEAIYPFADAGQRVDWAHKDGEAFGELSKWFNEAGAYAVHVQRDGNRWQATWHRFIEADVEAEKFKELARLLGSFLDHQRAALNYATYQLALHALRVDPSLKGKLIPEKVEFPSFQDREVFGEQNKVKKLPEKYRRAIESVQPYDGRYPGLWMLHELAREYRHRVLHPTAIIPADDVPQFLVDGDPVDPPVDLEVIPHERLVHGDEVMRFSLDVPPDAKVHPQLAIKVGIDHPLTRSLIGTSVLNRIAEDSDVALGKMAAAMLRAYTEIDHM